MRKSVASITIRCVEPEVQYVLQFAGANWSETFPSMEAAVLRAAQLVVEETDLTFYDATGKGTVVTRLFPLPIQGQDA